jgi:hypothetical protein
MPEPCGRMDRWRCRTSVTQVELHADVEPLAALLGTWSGEGEGSYPTIEPFRYREEVTFDHVGKPFLAYRQATVNLATGLPAHAEVGYVRAVGDGALELVLAHPTGIAEVAEGTFEQAGETLILRLHSTRVTRTGTAKEVTSVERQIEVSAGVLRYDLAMSAVGQPHQHHLAAVLHRSSPRS